MSDSLKSLYYDGSTLLMPLSRKSQIPLDQLNFFTTHLASITLGNLFRIYLNHEKCKPMIRHYIEIIFGLSLAYFCYGKSTIDVLVPCLISYIIMKWSPCKPSTMASAVTAFNMLYLSYCHIWRMQLDYGGYTLDISGPLMIAVQKLTSLAFNLSDGLNSLENNEGSNDMKHLNSHTTSAHHGNNCVTNEENHHDKYQFDNKINDYIHVNGDANNVKLHKTKAIIANQNSKYFLYKPPSLLHVLSYIFSFHSLMCGPFFFFSDYIKFINGSIYSCEGKKYEMPNPLPVLKVKIVKSIIFGIITVFVLPRWPSTLITGDSYVEHSFIGRNIMMLLVSLICRYKYYFAWTLGETGNISAGFGFNGYDSDGSAKWNLIDNYDLRFTELGTSMKDFLDNWNKSTNVWLRYLVYNRTRSTMSVFIFSACWHGFYPGYFFAFLSGGLFLNAIRRVRKVTKPFIEHRPSIAPLYNLLCFLGTQVLLCYIGFPFMLLLFTPTWHVYSHLYFYLHIIAIFILVFSFINNKFKIA